MKKVNCIIVDDEPLAAKVLEKYIAKLDHLYLVGNAENAMKAFDLISSQEVDVMFLDIKMPQISGIDFFRSLNHAPSVIFTTAYRDFAVDGFEMSAIDYLLKPISFERFLKAISKISINQPFIEGQVVHNLEQEYIFVREDKRMKKILYSDILFIESIKDYVKIISKNGIILTYIKMGYLENNLPVKWFVRVHKSFIINVNAIDAYSATELELDHSIIPIGRHYKQAVHKILDGLML